MSSSEAGRTKSYISIVSAFLALLSALSSLMLTRTLNRSVLAKNEEAITQSQIADQWAYYQSKNIRLEIRQRLQEIKEPTEVADTLDLELKKFNISDEARRLEKVKESLQASSRLLAELAQHFSAAVALLQVALMLMPIVYLRDSRTFLSIAGALGMLGSILFATGLIRFVSI